MKLNKEVLGSELTKYKMCKGIPPEGLVTMAEFCEHLNNAGYIAINDHIRKRFDYYGWEYKKNRTFKCRVHGKEVKRMIGEGLSLTEIAHKLGTSLQLVHREIGRLGLLYRPSNPKQAPTLQLVKNIREIYENGTAKEIQKAEEVVGYKLEEILKYRDEDDRYIPEEKSAVEREEYVPITKPMVNIGKASDFLKPQPRYDSHSNLCKDSCSYAASNGALRMKIS